MLGCGVFRREADLNTIKNIWVEVKRTMPENWSDSPPKFKDAISTHLLTVKRTKLLHSIT